MKKVLIAAVAVFAVTGVQAADMAVQVYTKAPVAVPFTWTGSYIGGFFGGAGAGNVSTDDPGTAVGGFFNNFVRTSVPYKLGSSAIGGLTSGYNWQFAPNWVIGYEGETGYMRLRGSAPDAGVTANDTIVFTKMGDWYSAYTLRLGYAMDRSLLYVKGGATLMRVETGVVDTTVVTLDTTTKKWQVGYAAGGGWEYALDPKWSLKAEYLYLGMEGAKVANRGVASNTAVLFGNTTLAGIHTGKIGLNYKWDWFSMFR